MDKRFLFFDLGGVLIRFLYDFLVERLARMFGVGPVAMVEFIESIWISVETGCSEDEIYNLFRNRFRVCVDRREFVAVFGLSVEAQDEYRRRPLFKRLRKAGVEFGIISNINAIHAAETQVRFSSIFEGISQWRRFYSFKMGMRKDKTGEMFKAVCQRCDIDPRQAILIDDSPENILGVNAVGGAGIVFRSFHRVEHELIQRGVLRNR